MVSSTSNKDVWPAEIRLQKDRKGLVISFEDGVSCALSSEFLRVHSPSAEVQGHHPDQRITVPGKRNVGITAVEPVGHYAVRIVFDDGHDTGLYSWSWLYRLAGEREALWATYLGELQEKGLDRG